MKIILEEKQKRKQEKLEKSKESQINEKKVRKVTKKIQFEDSSTDSDVSMIGVTDDNEPDDIGDMQDTENNVCLLCGEFGRDRELWFRCINCAGWVHAECSGANKAKSYVCDLCQ